jgi:nucleoside-diphosphate-sugar epimerase
MKIGIVGASGVIGRRVLAPLLQQGHEVRCIVRSAERSPIASLPLTERLTQAHADILEPDSLAPALQGLEVLINLATFIPNGKGRGDWALNDRIRTEGTRHVLDILQNQGKRCRLIQQSVAMLHQGNKPAIEDTELQGQGVLTSSLVMESAVQSSDLDWVLVRGAAVYGPDTARDIDYFGRIAFGKVQAPVHPQHWLSLIHITDLVQAFVHSVTLPGRQAYIAADDQPISYAELFSHYRGMHMQASSDKPVLPALPSFRVSNQRLRNTGWSPRYPSVLHAISPTAAYSYARAAAKHTLEVAQS